jgi:hypothetical protein
MPPILPFSKRTTASVSIFACFTAATNARKLTTDPATLAALRLEHANLFQSYRLLRFQNTPFREQVLDAAITKAQTAVSALNATVSGMPQPSPESEDKFALSLVQSVVAGAMQSMASIVANE